MIIADNINQLLIKDFDFKTIYYKWLPNQQEVQKTLDVFITNYSQLWKSPMIFNGLVRSDHMVIVVNPQFLANPKESVCFRDVCEHRKIKMEKKLAEYDWTTIASVQNIDNAAYKLGDSILSLVNECFPQIKV